MPAPEPESSRCHARSGAPDAAQCGGGAGGRTARAARASYRGVGVYVVMRDPKGGPAPIMIGRLRRTGLRVSAVLTVVLGLVPGLLLTLVGNAARALTL